MLVQFCAWRNPTNAIWRCLPLIRFVPAVEAREPHRRVAAARPQAWHHQQAVGMRRADFALAVQRDERVALRDDVAAAELLHEGE
jgi:hypothetical protein